MTLPTFRYHPDPIATGSVVDSDTECACCRAARGYVYGSLPYAEEDLESRICPWCIASGAAHEMFDAEFTPRDGIGDRGRWVTVPDDVRDDVAFRTLGFTAWQEERWWTHCGRRELTLE